MSSKGLYASDLYVIELDTKINVLKCRWLRPVNVEEMKTGGTTLYEALQQTQAEHVVANTQLLKSLDSDTM